MTTETARGLSSSTRTASLPTVASSSRMAASKNPEATMLNAFASNECAPARMRMADARS